jgi:predicted nucleotidyltransferase
MCENKIMIPDQMLKRAIERLRQEVPTGSRIILFGSQATATANDESDADFLIIEPELTDRRSEMVRLRQILRPLRIPVDIVVVSLAIFETWKNVPNTLLFDAATKGKEYGIAA